MDLQSGGQAQQGVCISIVLLPCTHTVLGVWQEKYHLTIFTKGQTRTHTHLFWVNASPLG